MTVDGGKVSRQIHYDVSRGRHGSRILSQEEKMADQERLAISSVSSLIATVALALLCARGTVTAEIGPLMWVCDTNRNLYKLNCSTGETEWVGMTGQILTDIAFDPSGRLFGMDAHRFYEINPGDASLTQIGETRLNWGMNGLVSDPAGTLWIASGTALWTIDPATAELTEKSDLGGYATAGDLAFDAKGTTLYLTTQAGEVVSFTVADGDVQNEDAPTLVGDMDLLSLEYAFAFDRGPDDVLYAYTNFLRLLRIDVEPFAVTTLIDRVTADNFPPPHVIGSTYGGTFLVPEPATVLLLALGALAMRKRRRKSV